MALKYLEAEREQADKRKREGSRRGGKSKAKATAKLQGPSLGEAAAKAGARLGVGGRYVYDARMVLEADVELKVLHFCSTFCRARWDFCWDSPVQTATNC